MPQQKPITIAGYTLLVHTVLSVLLIGLMVQPILPLEEACRQFYLLCGILIPFLLALSALFVEGPENPLQMIGELFQALQLPQLLHKTPLYGMLFVIGNVLLLWLPILFGGYTFADKAFLPLVLLATCTIAFLRGLDYAEKQTAAPITTQEQLQLQQTHIYGLLLLIALLCALGTAPLILFLLYRISKPHEPVHVMIFFPSILAVIGLFFIGAAAFLYRRHVKQLRLALETLQLQYQLEQNQLYLDLLSQKYQTLRQYQHDFKKHLAYIQQLAQQRETEQITQYIAAIYSDLQAGAMYRFTGNQTLDLLLSDKQQQAQKQAVALTIDYQPPADLRQIAAPDLCVILGNLLDNAITAATASKKRNICCTIQQKNQYYTLLQISNSCDVPPVFLNGIPQTTQLPSQHGYGIRNVMERAKKYGGHCQFTYDEKQKVFSAAVLLSSSAFIQNL